MLTAEQLAAAVAEAPIDRLPDLIGLLAAAQARAMARMVAPAPAPIATDEWVTAAVVAERFNLSVSTVNEMARAGKLPCRMFGRYRRFNVVEVGHHIDRRGIQERKAA